MKIKNLTQPTHRHLATYLVSERGLVCVADNLEELLHKIGREEITFKRKSSAALAIDHAEYYIEHGWFGGFCADMLTIGLLVQPTVEQFNHYAKKYA